MLEKYNNWKSKIRNSVDGLKSTMEMKKKESVNVKREQ